MLLPWLSHWGSSREQPPWLRLTWVPLEPDRATSSKTLGVVTMEVKKLGAKK